MKSKSESSPWGVTLQLEALDVRSILKFQKNFFVGGNSAIAGKNVKLDCCASVCGDWELDGDLDASRVMSLANLPLTERSK